MKIQMPSGHCPPIFPPLGRTLVSAVVRIVTETVTENAILRPLPSAVCFQGTLDGNDPESSHVTLGPTRVASARDPAMPSFPTEGWTVSCDRRAPGISPREKGSAVPGHELRHADA